MYQSLMRVHDKGPSINYGNSRGRGGQKLPILLIKKTTKRGEGVKNCDIVYGRPLSWTKNDEKKHGNVEKN